MIPPLSAPGQYGTVRRIRRAGRPTLCGASSMAVSTAPNPATDRDLASMAEARALARRAKRPRRCSPNSRRNRSTPSSTRWPPPSRRRPKRWRASPSKRPASASSPTRSRRTCSRRDRVHEFIRPMKTVGVVAPARGQEGHRDCRAVRRRRRHRAVDQPDLDGDLQDPDRAQGALRDRHQPAPVGGALHHARRRDHGRGRAPAPARPTAPSAG